MHIVFVRPEIPPNSGTTARLCVATGTTFHLVGPLGFSLDDRYLKRAGLDYWPHVDLRVYDSWKMFLETRPGGRLLLFSARASRSYTEVRYHHPHAYRTRSQPKPINCHGHRPVRGTPTIGSSMRSSVELASGT